MSNRIRSAVDRLLHKNRPTCRNCKGRDIEIKEYRDADLLICKRCKFPWRVKK